MLLQLSRHSSIVPEWLKQRQKKHGAWFRIALPLSMVLLVGWLLSGRGGSLNYRPMYPSTPLVNRYIDFGQGSGGRFFIPWEWYSDIPESTNFPDDRDYFDMRNPRGPGEAAHQALNLCLRHNLYLEHTQIPLIIHQTWKNFESDTWSPLVRDSVETWLRLATGAGEEFGKKMPRMAYIMWDDYAVEWFMTYYENNSSKAFKSLPHNVEKADVFRVAVLKWFGGIYADVDTRPLQHPALWVQGSDMGPWTNPATRETYRIDKVDEPSFVAPEGAPSRPAMHLYPDSPYDVTKGGYSNNMLWHAPANDTISVRAIVGIEGDNPPETDDYWRMGYTYPVQLTNWAFAMSPQHPIAQKYLHNVWDHIRTTPSHLEKVDPLDLTGPPAFTKTVMAHASAVHGDKFDWTALTGRNDELGGRGKIVAKDMMVLPITGFSPGRGKFHNMGSMPLDHKNARLYHAAAGSWRNMDLRVQAGKMCRTFLGRCRDWEKWT